MRTDAPAIRHRGKPRKPEAYSEILRLYREGYGLKIIRRLTGFAQTTIHTAIRKSRIKRKAKFGRDGVRAALASVGLPPPQFTPPTIDPAVLERRQTEFAERCYMLELRRELRILERPERAWTHFYVYRYGTKQRVINNLRSRLRKLVRLRRTIKKGSMVTLVGCSVHELCKHIESTMTKRMTWANYGTYWHIDHVLPCNAFNLFNTNEVARCFHFTNLQALEAVKNIRKSDTITEAQTKLLLSYV